MLGVNENLAEEKSQGFTKTFIEPGIGEYSVLSASARVSKNGDKIGVSLWLQDDEDLGDKGKEIKDTVNGDIKATGKSGKVSIGVYFDFTNPVKLAALSKNLTALAIAVGKLDEMKLIKTTETDPVKSITEYMTKYVAVVKGCKFYAKLKGKQNGKYDDLSFSQGWNKDENEHYPISVYLSSVVEDLKKEDTGDYIKHTLTYNGGKESKFEKKKGENTWDYTWEEQASSELDTGLDTDSVIFEDVPF